tara:strand:- start:24702 stop:25079 length:378 start_codon:yes stop_codon:yes gene_type:complete
MNNIIIGISVVLNAILLMFLFGITPFFLYLSILINLGLIWYIKKALNNNQALETDVDDVMEKLNVFTDHIENVYELEMYYGDENLESLLTHSRELINDFVDFQEKYFDVEVEDEQSSQEATPEEE